ncbi:MAG: heme oxygenase, partial [Bacteroidetes bacterium]|nr:heme oxygenase [Bacteroidota bacterium]
MFAIVLKESTARAHAALEKQLVARIRKINSPGDYVQLLTLMYGYYQPLETALAPWLTNTHFADGSERRKAGLIPADI